MKKKKDWFDKALEHQDKGNYSQAIVAIEKYVELNPDNKPGKFLKAVIYGDLCNYELVLNLLNANPPLPEDGKRYARLYFKEMGDTFNELGNHDIAAEWYDKMIEVSPNETDGYIFKGSCLASAGKYELAKIEHLKATQLEGFPEEAFYNLALIFRAEMKFEEAAMYCKKSLQIDPNDQQVIDCYKDIKKAIKLKRKIGNQ